MLYKITKPLAKIALSSYFRKIYFSNADRIPKNKPVILAANHPTAFIEPCILACWLEEPLHFMARGDFVLRSSFFKKLYELYHIIPIYRIQDGGYGKLKDNFSAFAAGTEVLRQNKMVLIMAEGGTEHEKRLREIKKGVARVAFGSLEKYPDLDIQIVPVAVNYSNSDKMRSVAMIDFGEPISVQKYLEEFKENKNKAVRLVTQEIQNSLSERVIHIENRNEEKEVEKLLDYLEASKVLDATPSFEKSAETLYFKKGIIDKVNQAKPEDKVPLFERLNQFEEECKRLNISFLGSIMEDGFNLNVLPKLILFFPIFLIGYLGNFLPAWSAGFLSKKFIKDITFRASTSVVLGIVLYLIYWLVLMVIGAIIGNIWLVFGIIILPILGKIALKYKEVFKIWREGKRIKKLSKADQQKLRNARENLDFHIKLIQQK